MSLQQLDAFIWAFCNQCVDKHQCVSCHVSELLTFAMRGGICNEVKRD